MISQLSTRRYFIAANLALLLLLFLFPFSRAFSMWNIEYLSHLDLSTNFFHTASSIPMLYPLLAVLIGNLLIAGLARDNSIQSALVLGCNVLGALLFAVAFFLSDAIIGLGGYIYFFALVVFVAGALTQRGVIKGDTFVSSSILIISILMVVFILLPLLTMLKESMMLGGEFSPRFLLSHLSRYIMLGRVTRNTIVLGVSSAGFSTIIGLIFALVSTRGRYSFVRRLARPFSILPIITPPFVLGLALIYMLGRMGYVTHGLMGLRTGFIYGYPGLVIVQTMSFAPMAFMIIAGNLAGIHADLEEASSSLGASQRQTLSRVLLPLLRPALANSFLVSFALALADFGNPMILGGDFDVLSTEIYFAIIGRYDQSLAAALGLILLSLTIGTFFLQQWWVGGRSYVTVTGKGSRKTSLQLPKGVDVGMTVFASFWIALTVLLYGSVILGSFVKLWGIDYSFTLSHYRAFLIDGLRPYKTTLVLALISTVPTVIVGWLIAYLTKRFQFAGKKILEGVSLLSFAIPGTVVGIGYLLMFNKSPLLLTNTAFILIMCFVFRNMPVGIRSSLSALEQIDVSLDEASLSLGANNFQTMRRVMLPLVKAPLLTGMIYSFVRAMTAISAVIFLYTAKTKLATVTILGRIEAGRLGLATAFCTIMIFTMALVIFAMYFIVVRVWGEKIDLQS